MIKRNDNIHVGLEKLAMSVSVGQAPKSWKTLQKMMKDSGLTSAMTAQTYQRQGATRMGPKGLKADPVKPVTDAQLFSQYRISHPKMMKLFDATKKG